MLYYFFKSQFSYIQKHINFDTIIIEIIVRNYKEGASKMKIKNIFKATAAIFIAITAVISVNVSAQEEKYIHISFDDVYNCISDISSHNYSSVFDNSFLGDLKHFHDTYGAVFTLNCFNTCSKQPDYDISNMPDTYIEELSENSDWLKFSFHSEDENANYGSSENTSLGTATGDCEEKIKASYNKFTSAILNATGTANSIDRVARLGFFGGTENNVKALMECEYGITGLLAADDTRISYYLNDIDNNYLLKNYEYYDKNNDIKMFKSQVRLENVRDNKINEQFSLISSIDSNMIEIFTHEQNYNNSVKARLEEYLKWAKNKNYGFAYAQDIMKKRITVTDRKITPTYAEYSVRLSDGKDGELIAVLYDNDGKLISIKCCGSKKINTVTFDTTNASNGKVKFFMWNSIAGMEPISESVEESAEYTEPNSKVFLDRTSYPLYVGNASVTDFTKWDGYGSSFNLNASVISDEYSESDIKWITSDEDIISVKTNNGAAEIKGRRTGAATVTAKLPDGASAVCSVTVIDNASRLTVEKLSFNITLHS